jgi:regulatory protein
VAPRVTALVQKRNGRVRVELDGADWRTLPAAAVARAQLLVGTELDRSRARELRRALRGAEALELAARALARRDRPSASVAARLERHRVSPVERARTLARLEEAGIVDDGRFAAGRAAALAARGWGNAAIEHDLERQGLDRERIEQAVAALAGEQERVAAIVERSGPSARTARRLAARGFSEEAVESAFGAAAEDRGA